MGGTMLRRMIIPLAALCVFPQAASAQELVWSDEFEGSTLDPANWECMIGDGTAYGLQPGWGNNELEYYTSRPENVFVSGGYLHIIARQENYAGHTYTSARLRTKDLRDFLYGRIEARIQLPSTKGIWPAFWMMPTDSVYGGWAASGEIDILESINIATTVYGTIHYGGPWPENVFSGGSLNNGTNFSNDFHTYAIEWSADLMRWYVDGSPYYSVTSATWYSTAAPSNDRAPFDQLFHILLNVAVGGNWPGYPDGSSVFPQEMLVDWVRVSTTEPSGQSPFGGQARVIPGRIEVEDFDEGGPTVVYYDCDPINHGGAYRPGEGVDIQACGEGGFNVGWMCANEWTEYTVDVPGGGLYRLDARVASQNTGGTFHLEFNGVNRTGDVVVPATGGWQQWTTVSRQFGLTQGSYVMRFANADSTNEYNVNYFDFTYLCTKGDLDRSGHVDGHDMDLFVPTLLAPSSATAAQICATDMDGDGAVESDDIPLFVNCMLGLGCP
jgi:beta-glucanase (GH16 family)